MMNRPQTLLPDDRALAAELAQLADDFYGPAAATAATTVGENFGVEGDNYLDNELDIAAAASCFADVPTSDINDSLHVGTDNEDALSDDDPVTPSCTDDQSECGCPKKCLALFSGEEILQNQLVMQELDRADADMFMLGVVESSKFCQDLTTHKTKRKYAAFTYSFQGKIVCVKAFGRIYCLGSKGHRNLISHLKERGPSKRVHGNAGRRPAHSLQFSQVEHVVKFIKSLSEKFGIPHPAPLHGRSTRTPVFLPANFTYISCHQKYLEACREAKIQPVGFTSFRSIWLQCIPHNQIITPRTDVCQQCEQLRKKVSEAMGEAEKLAACDQLSTHVRAAQKERDVHTQATQAAKNELAQCSQIPSPPCLPCQNSLLSVHYTFEFAQNVYIPHAPLLCNLWLW